VTSTDGRRLAIFLRREEQKVQQTLSDSATIIGGNIVILPDQSAIYYPQELSFLGQIWIRRRSHCR